MNRADIQRQVATCAKFDVAPMPCLPHDKVGIARNVKAGIEPIHGLRIPPTGETTGWYIWAGDWSDDPDFFVPLHAEHLASWCPQVIPYLQLPTGWRFLLAPNHTDVWFDEELARAEA